MPSQKKPGKSSPPPTFLKRCCTGGMSKPRLYKSARGCGFGRTCLVKFLNFAPVNERVRHSSNGVSTMISTVRL